MDFYSLPWARNVAQLFECLPSTGIKGVGHHDSLDGNTSFDHKQASLQVVLAQSKFINEAQSQKL